MKFKSLLLLPPILLALAPSVPAATFYNAVTDFSTASNPNGVWAYGTNSGTGGAFQLFTNSSSSSPLAYWSRDNSALYYPNVQKNVTGSTFTNGFGLSVPTDVLYLSPGLEFGSGSNSA
jgi:hypothetical protein